MIDAHQDELWMKLALRLARRAWGNVAPNPLVGAVIVKDGQLISTGYHKKQGTAHAEVIAITEAGERARGATIYVTLEPCCHWGSTPPCTQAIIEAGLLRVVFSQTDPNPKVRQCDSKKILLDAGINVHSGVLLKQAKEQNRYFNTSILTGYPYVTLKLGMTIDGMIADRYGTSKWITNEHSRQFVQKLRREHDAVLVGIGTVLADDPSLTVRDPKKKQPIRIILDPQLESPLDAALFKGVGQTFIITQSSHHDSEKAKILQTLGAVVLGLDLIDEQFNIDELLVLLSKQGIWSVLVEGGGGVAQAFERSGRINRYIVFQAPKILADKEAKHGFSGNWDHPLSQVSTLKLITVRRYGDDVMLVYEPKKLS